MIGKLKVGLAVGSLALMLSAFNTSPAASASPLSPDRAEPQSNLQSRMEGSTTYTITVRTGIIKNGGTNANVSIQLTGKNKQKTGWLLLDIPGYNDFEQGDNDSSAKTTTDVGDIVEVCVKHDNSGSKPGWFLEDVTVQKYGGKQSYFYFGQWLARDEPPGVLQACKKAS